MLISWLSLAVPSAAPKITSAYNTSSTSISVHWTPIPENVTNGILLGYKVIFRIRDLPETEQLLTIRNQSTSVELQGLKAFREYVIFVEGFTVKGSGINDSVACTTDEDGNLCVYYN